MLKLMIMETPVSQFQVYMIAIREMSFDVTWRNSVGTWPIDKTVLQKDPFSWCWVFKILKKWIKIENSFDRIQEIPLKAEVKKCTKKNWLISQNSLYFKNFLKYCIGIAMIFLETSAFYYQFKIAQLANPVDNNHHAGNQSVIDYSLTLTPLITDATVHYVTLIFSSTFSLSIFWRTSSKISNWQPTILSFAINFCIFYNYIQHLASSK